MVLKIEDSNKNLKHIENLIDNTIVNNLANNTSLQVGTSFFSVICASCLCIIFILNSRKK